MPLVVVLFLVDLVHAVALRPAILDPLDTIGAAGLAVIALGLSVSVLLAVEIVAFTVLALVDTGLRQSRLSSAVPPILAAAISSPLLWLLARQPFVGNRYRDSEWAVVGPWLVFAALFMVVMAAAWVALRAFRWWFAAGASTRTALTGSLLCGLILLPVMLIDALWYAGWYPLVHSVLSLTAVVLLQALLARYYLCRSIRPRRHVAVAAVGLVAAGVCVAWWHPIQAWRVSSGTLLSSRIVTPALALTAPVETLELWTDVREVNLQALHASQVMTVPGALASNALLVTADTLRADAVRFRGDQATLTPAIDDFFGEGLVFERAYSQYAATRHSIRALLQSSYQDRKDVQSPDLIRRLRHFGFSVVAILPSDMKMFVNVERYNFTRVAFYDDERTVPDLAREILASVPEDKRVVWIHLYQPHDPYTPGPEFVRASGSRGKYDAEVRWMDADFARILALFRKTPEIVVFGADHGEEFRDHGGTLHGRTTYEETIRVPLAVRVQGRPAGRTAEPVANVDIAPTLLAALGIPIPDAYEGYDLLGRASRAPRDRVIYSESVTNAITAVSGTKKWTYWSDLGLWEMYDLADDPRERRNLARDGSRLAKGRELIALYRLAGPALANLRDMPVEEFSEWFGSFVARLETQPEVARWVAYQLASRFPEDSKTAELVADAARREKQPALAAFLAGLRRGVAPSSLDRSVRYEFMVPIRITDQPVEITETAPTLAARTAAYEALAARDPVRGAELLDQDPLPAEETAALLRGLARSGNRSVAGSFSTYIDHEDADVRAAATAGWCDAGGTEVRRSLAARVGQERSPEIVQRLIGCLLQYERSLGIAALRGEIDHRMLSDLERARLIQRYAVAEGADHLVELFVASQSGSFRDYLFHALSQLPLPIETFDRMARVMQGHANESRLRAHIDADLRQPRSQAPCNKYGKSPEARERACSESPFGCTQQRPQ